MKRSTEFNVVPGQTLQILVENNGRLTSSVYNRTYGIIGDALLNDLVLNNWVITGFPFTKLDNDPRLNKLLNAVPVVRQDPTVLSRMLNRKTALFSSEPIVFKESFYVNQVEISDTFVNPTGWGKVCVIMYLSLLRISIENQNVIFFVSFHQNKIGIHIHKWFQHRTILANFWATNYIVCSERDSC